MPRTPSMHRLASVAHSALNQPASRRCFLGSLAAAALPVWSKLPLHLDIGIVGAGLAAAKQLLS